MTRFPVVLLQFLTIFAYIGLNVKLSFVVASNEDVEERDATSVLRSSLQASVCSLPPLMGDCDGAIPRYFFDQETQKCLLFIYGGCGGNGNNFFNRTDCEATCPPLPTCQQPQVVGPCDAAILRFYFNSAIGKCEEFIYGGCGGNSNNFVSLSDCEKTCLNGTTPSPVVPPPVCSPILAPLPVCQQPKVVGPCEALIPRFYFNSTIGKCEAFMYGGCEGNENNFLSLSACEKTCLNGTAPSPVAPSPVCSPVLVPLPVCQQPKVVGPCKGSFPRFYFNSTNVKCEEFIYGGCEGNDNNFLTESDCRAACINTPAPITPCNLCCRIILFLRNLFGF